MMWPFFWSPIVGFCVFQAVLSSVDVSSYEERQLKIVKHILHRYRTNSTFAKLYDQWEKSQNESLGGDFPCEPMSPSQQVPASVHRLRPGDIKVIGAVGDSLTAGRGAKFGVVGLLSDFPEVSWSIGGSGSFETQVTLPNLIRKYNPDVIGAAVSTSKRKLNKAVSGAKSADIYEELMDLVDWIKKDKRIDFEKDWKLITIFIGGNDLCAICDDYDFFSPESYIERVKKGVDYLLGNLPRTFVNLVEVLNVEMVQELDANLLCDGIHLWACQCAAFPKSKEAEAKVIEYRLGYQKKLRELATLRQYNDRDDFTVVLQPFYRDTYPPYDDKGKLDLSYFASDCFHQSSKGQQAAAKALWNNMLEPVGSKRLDWHPHEPLECPTEKRPYLFTAKNSRDY